MTPGGYARRCGWAAGSQGPPHHCLLSPCLQTSVWERGREGQQGRVGRTCSKIPLSIGTGGGPWSQSNIPGPFSRVSCQDSLTLLVLWGPLSLLEPPPSPNICGPLILPRRQGLDQAVARSPQLSTLFRQPAITICTLSPRATGQSPRPHCLRAPAAVATPQTGLGTPLSP